jgi:phosphoglycerate dehydrogenase-like enzyme
VYNRNIKVVSANTEMARHVAEVTLCLMLSSLHKIPQCDKSVRQNTLKHPDLDFLSLFGANIGMIGLGTIGRFLLDLLVPFGCKIKIYDPFIEKSAISKWPNVSLSSLNEAMSQPIVTVHASRTPETYHMINKEKLSLIPDGGLIINTARAEIIDTKALIEEMKSGRIFAAVDVYDEEKVETLPTDILHFPNNSILTPHIGAASATWHLTNAAISDVERFVKGEALQYEVSRRQFELMTR